MEDLLGQSLLIVTLAVDEAGDEIAGGVSERSYGRVVGVAGTLVTVELDDGARRVLDSRQVPIVRLEGRERRFLGAGKRRRVPRYLAKQKRVLTLDR